MNTREEGELKFWREWFASGKGKKYEGHRRLSNVFDQMIGDKKEVRIANLGAGAVNMIGDTRKDIEVTVVASDLLAKEYQALWEETQGSFPTFVEYQDMADLNYSDNWFDIVYCTNALDHSKDPHKALKEMVRICKPGGWIYLQHQAHEGRRLGYNGMHEWNIDVTSGDDCLFWNRDKDNLFLLSTILYKAKNSVRQLSKAKIITTIAQNR